MGLTQGLGYRQGDRHLPEGRDLVQCAKRTRDQAVALTAPALAGGQSPAVVRIQARVRSVPLSEKRDQADRQDLGEYAHHDDGNTARSRRSAQPAHECHPARAVNHPHTVETRAFLCLCAGACGIACAPTLGCFRKHNDLRGFRLLCQTIQLTHDVLSEDQLSDLSPVGW